MTREEEIRNAIDTIFPIPHSGKGRTYEQALMATGFEAGVKWADANPKSSWISVEDDLPCNHEELMEDKHCTKSVLAVLARDKDPSMGHIEICSMCDMFNSINMGWHWCNGGYYHVVYWMPLPDMPD